MVNFYSENDFELTHEDELEQWIEKIIVTEGYEPGELSYVFCDDEYLLKINQDFLNHDTYTDIITFNYNLGKQVNSEIYISTERVRDNAEVFKVTFADELHRVMIHGIFHLCGYGDSTEDEKSIMRTKENEALTARKFV
jgi:rRNA maturation RNase YbeY